jgi:hypothetical protein
MVDHYFGHPPVQGKQKIREISLQDKTNRLKPEADEASSNRKIYPLPNQGKL